MLSTYVYSYDNESLDRYYEVEITYEAEDGYWDQVPGGYYHQKYYVPGEITVACVRVLLVDYYNESGSLIGTIKRPNMINEAWEELDSEATAYIEGLIDDQAPDLYEDLMENRG